jgi:hypothetical protein
MQDILNLIANYGIGMVCVGYLIYFQSTTMKDMKDTLLEISKTLVSLDNRLHELEEKKG